MNEFKYDIYIDRERVASDMTYEIVAILIEGLINEYDDPDMQISILRVKEECDDE